MLSKKHKEEIAKKYGRKEGDTGSPEVQVAFITRRINELTAHLRKHRGDKHSRRGLLQLVADRQTHLRYLKKKSEERWTAVMKKIGLK
ncbi:MAG: 30S ribosomal protein S15 [Candidatus Lloydbacteria bacterium RIFCSPHIGHO2_02_FULL_51_22]|uniref:Small ribosomal subunit protein uS15 n=3 Tax=Candidatus Lloydiibacteriota TaxID=1817910 RepID=A0A1G2DFV0_9BACT|nr:MAG: 30S ribosomal protein S15 [Candidatus Lloydbacteria bacterium RIFCSPHIGHO2_02_FULL_51_22]OGZ15883.1 MAG: 30S ribosomal protein S15 [Candidatus Lloydbacteria bacterium RIFCSPLOWO2_02_FULL_51_11]OGZ16248.1 MAG: 30S ribosomal protein S15 [Candidatus Lloydbacteria bacterium RIFCSPLOWO2_12_FULL_51_9]